MTPDEAAWIYDQKEKGWLMPRAAWWKRLPIVRHIRCAVHGAAIERHNFFYRSMGMIPQKYDQWVLYGIFHGKERQL